MITLENRKRIADAVTAKMKHHGIGGGIAEYVRLYVAQRVSVNAAGELRGEAPRVTVADGERNGWNASSYVSGDVEDVPFDDFLDRIFDGNGPLAALSHRQLAEIEAQWDQQIESDRFQRDLNERRQRDNAEVKRVAAWRAQPRDRRALLRLGSRPVTGEAFAAAMEQEAAAHSSMPPADWVPSPDVPRPKSFGETWPDLTCVASPKKVAPAVSHRTRTIGGGTLEITQTTIGDMAAKAKRTR